MNFDLTGKSCLVTGASSGLGEHFARTLAKAGAELWLAARRTDRIAALAEELAAAGTVAHTIALDVRDQASIAAALAAPGRIDVLVNNAGVTGGQSALDLDEEEWDFVVDTNLKGAYFVAQAAARRMKAEGGGAIVNIASILGFRQAGMVAPYAISKAGAVQMTKVMALEWARYGVRVNAIAPGYIATEINGEFWESDAGKRLIARVPQRRLGQPGELDGALLLLASDASSFMTGSVITVDGGHLLSTL